MHPSVSNLLKFRRIFPYHYFLQTFKWKHLSSSLTSLSLSYHDIRLFSRHRLRYFHSSLLQSFLNYRRSNFSTNATDNLTNSVCTLATTMCLSPFSFGLWLLILEHFFFLFLAFWCFLNFLKPIILSPPFVFKQFFFVSNSFQLVYPYLFNITLFCHPSTIHVAIHQPSSTRLFFGFIHVVILTEGYNTKSQNSD